MIVSYFCKTQGVVEREGSGLLVVIVIVREIMEKRDRIERKKRSQGRGGD